MPATTESSLKTKSATTSALPSSKVSMRSGLMYGAVFALALAARMSFAFIDGHRPIVFSCDASEYLRDANGLAQIVFSQHDEQFFQTCIKSLSHNLAPAATEQLRQAFLPIKELAIAGPVFPFFLLSTYAILGLPVTQSNWAAPVICQTILTAVTCVLIAWLGRRAWGHAVGITAGIIAALYPGFIVNSIRLYSESFSCFWLCAVVALTIPVLERRGLFHSLATGASLAILQLSRSVMVLVTGMVFLVTGWLSQGRSRWLRFAGLVAGMAFVFAPWLVTQELAFGKSSLVVDRIGHYNLFIGTNISTQGWLSYPYPDGRGIEKKSYATLVGAQIKESPERFVRLMLDKPARLLKFPWNDFRTAIGPFNMQVQVLIHQTLLALSVIGLTLYAAGQWRARSSGSDLRRMLSVLLAMHVVYLMFITVPRYNFTAMPFIILFAAAALVTLCKTAFDFGRNSSIPSIGQSTAVGLALSLALALVTCRIDWLSLLTGVLGDNLIASLVVAVSIKMAFMSTFFIILYKAVHKLTNGNWRLGLLPIAMAVVIIPLCTLPLRAHSRFYEWKETGSKALRVTQEIVLPTNKIEDLSSRPCYVLVDGRDWQVLGNGGQLSVNGTELEGPYLPVMPFAQDLAQTKTRPGKGNSLQHYLECEDIFASMTAAAGGGNLDLRQWFLAPIPEAVISEALKLREPVLNVELLQQRQARACSFGAYGDNPSTVRIPSVDRFSWEKAFYAVEEENGFTDPRYDQRLTINTKTESTRQPNIRLLVAPADVSAGAFRTQPPVLAAAHATAAGAASTTAITGSALPSPEEDATWTIEVKGAISSQASQINNIPIAIKALARSIDAKGIEHRYRSPWVPTSITVENGVNRFQFAYPFKPKALPGKLTELSVQIEEGGISSGNEYFSVRKSVFAEGTLGGGTAKIDDLSMEIRRLPTIPTGLGFEIF